MASIFFKPILTVYFNTKTNFNMPHSFNKIWIHAIWSTKERYPLIIPSAEKKVYDLDEG
jgi:hypothetical protein